MSTERPFLSYLATFNDDELSQLYEEKACVVAIYRMLPRLAQQCVLRLLSKAGNWRKWESRRNLAHLQSAVQLLFKLRIVNGDLEGGNIRLNEDFRMNYISSILSSALQLSGIRKVETLDEKARKAANKDLFKKAIDRWECILRYLALPSEKKSDKGEGVSADTRQLFQHIGFTRGEDRDMEITSLGFHFLLLNRVEQIWTYLIYYLKYCRAIGADVIKNVELLLRLTLCCSPLEADSSTAKDDPSRPAATPFYLNADWSEKVHNFLTHLRELGLIFIRKRKDGFFFLTPLLTLLATSGTGKDTFMEHDKTKGFLVVETNYRVYAYTNSNLQLAILSTFTELIYRFSDVVVGVLTRDSVRRALQAGITARQIVLYMRSNAHPETISAHGPQGCLPSTVIDQLHLWEDERKRLTYNESVLYNTFESENEYIGLRDFAKERKILLWHTDAKRMLAVTEEGHAVVRQWWNQRSAS
jgi:transcription initiation factor TFIIH subunit 4